MHTCTHTTESPNACSKTTPLSFLGQVGTRAMSSPCAPLSHIVLPYLMAVRLAESMGMGSFAARLYANLAQCLGGIRSVAAATPHVAGGQLVL